MPTKTDLVQARAEVMTLVETPAAIDRLTATLTQIGAQVSGLDTTRIEAQSAQLAELVEALNTSGERINDALAELRDLRETNERRQALLTWVPLGALALVIALTGYFGISTLGEMTRIGKGMENIWTLNQRVSQQLDEAAKKTEAKPETKPDPKKR